VTRPRIAVIYYSSTGTVHALAEALAEGAREDGAEVRLRRAAELAPASVVDRHHAWREHLAATESIHEARAEDLVWADGFALGTPTRFGTPASQLKQFIDTLGPQWRASELSNKPATTFTSSDEVHGGQESTLLALCNVLHQWGSVIIPPGYVDYDILHAAGGNPYGVSHVAGEGPPTEPVLRAARFQGARLAAIALLLRPLREPRRRHHDLARTDSHAHAT